MASGGRTLALRLSVASLRWKPCRMSAWWRRTPGSLSIAAIERASEEIS